MALTVTHSKNVAIADDPKAAAAGEVLPSDWNANHAVSGKVDPSLGARTMLTAETTFYVSGSGSDLTGDGSASKPWATIQHANIFISENIDAAGFNVIVQLADGTYAGTPFPGFGLGPPLSFPPNCPVYTINGNTGDQTKVIINDSLPILMGSCLVIGASTTILCLANLTFDANNVGTIGVNIQGPILIFPGDSSFSGTGPISFTNSSGGIAGYCIGGGGPYSSFVNVSTMTISGNWQAFCNLNPFNYVGVVGNLVLSGTPNWNSAFFIGFNGQVEVDGSIIGASTGPAFLCTEDCVWSSATTPGSSFGSFSGTFRGPSGGNSYMAGADSNALNATDGFLYLPTCAGQPTGTPTSAGPRVPLVYDITNNQLWIYAGGAWKQPKTPSAAAIVNWQ